MPPVNQPLGIDQVQLLRDEEGEPEDLPASMTPISSRRACGSPSS
jgi:hypothetical protein